MKNKKEILAQILSEYSYSRYPKLKNYLINYYYKTALELERAFSNPNILNLAADLILNRIDSSVQTIILPNKSRELLALGHAVSLKTINEETILNVIHSDKIRDNKQSKTTFCLFLLDEITNIENIKLAQMWCEEFGYKPIQLISLIKGKNDLENKTKNLYPNMNIESLFSIEEIEKFNKKE